MRSISERDLSVFIALLAAKIGELTARVQATESRLSEITEDEIDERVDIQETLQVYEGILETLRTEYESGVSEGGLNLPSYQHLTERFLG